MNVDYMKSSTGEPCQGSDVKIAEEDKHLLLKKTKLYYQEKLKELNKRIKEVKSAKCL